MMEKSQQLGKLLVTGFFDKATKTISYLLADYDSKKAVIIDPVLDFEANSGTLSTGSADKLLHKATTEKLDITHVLDTHVHADHLSAGDYIRSKTGARYGIGAQITEVQKAFKPIFSVRDGRAEHGAFDDLYADGDVIQFGEHQLEVLHTPGHTAACITYKIAGALFVGDAIFMPDFGTPRTDFPGGDAKTSYASIQRLLSHSDDTLIFVGHDYLTPARHEHLWQTTVAEQKRENVHVGNGRTEADFIAMREARDADLPAPALLLPSLQVNIRAGQLPEAEDNGQTYLKIPVKHL